MKTRLGSVLVIAKEPVPGRVKTRLSPAFTPVQAADLAHAALLDTLRASTAVDADQHVLVLDGSPTNLLPAGWKHVPQFGGGLDLRLAAAFCAVAGAGPAVLVGMDTPQLRPQQLAAFDPAGYDCCFGPATDGGFWAIGFREPGVAADVFPGVPMSRPDTGQRQLERLRDAGLRVQLLDELTDFDTAAAAAQVASVAPDTLFAAALSRVLAGRITPRETVGRTAGSTRVAQR